MLPDLPQEGAETMIPIRNSCGKSGNIYNLQTTYYLADYYIVRH